MTNRNWKRLWPARRLVISYDCQAHEAQLTGHGGPNRTVNMKFTGYFNVPQINLAGYKKILHDYMIKVITDATKAWLQAVVGEIPVWSGASLATFQKLAGEVKFDISIDPVVISRVDKGISSSEGRIETKEGRYIFYYHTTLPWLIYNEYFNANVSPDETLFYRLKKPGPYHFQIDGFEAFRAYADTVKLPSVIPFITSKRVNI